MKTKQYTSYYVLCSFKLNTQVAENLKPEIRYRHTIDFCPCKGNMFFYFPPLIFVGLKI